MRIIHTSDLHIDSPLSAWLSEPKASERRRELVYNFERLIDRAREIEAKIIIIAGDLFDSEKISKRAKDTVLSAIERAKDTAFLYLPGNHERDALLHESLPTNLHSFGADWTYFETEDFLFAGRSECAAGMFDTYKPSDTKKNIVVLHGKEAQHSDAGGNIGLSEIKNKRIDYLALGHYHRYSKKQIDGCSAVYSGTPEGRGFDELGEKGFSLIEYKNGVMRDGFVKFAGRRIYDIRADISSAEDTASVEETVRLALEAPSPQDIVRLNLVGKNSSLITKNKSGIEARYKERFYYFELRDESRTDVCAENYRYDKSLKGEFIRLVLSDTTLSEEEREKIIRTGLYALEGDVGEELSL